MGSVTGGTAKLPLEQIGFGVGMLSITRLFFNSMSNSCEVVQPLASLIITLYEPVLK